MALRDREFHPLKILHHVDRLRALARGEDTAPVTVEIDPVAWCNHACVWCVDPVHVHTSMDLALYEALLAELATFTVGGHRVQGIVFKGGGEPTLHPHFAAMLAAAHGAGFGVGVVTNGSRLSALVPTLVACAAYVRVSLDGPTAESHARIHQSADFSRIVAGVRSLVAARDSARSPVIGATFALDIHTVGLAEEAIALGESLGLDYVLLRPPFFEEVGAAPTMSVAEAQETRRRLRAAAEGYAGPLEVQVGTWVGDAEQKAMGAGGWSASGRRDQHRDERPIEHRTGRCLASPLLAVVTADGTLYGCCNLRALPSWAMGRLDYAQGRGFAALWAGKERAEALERMHRTDCIQHCTHPLSRYNEMIEVLRDDTAPHREFV